jgi:hypothetical protein
MQKGQHAILGAVVAVPFLCAAGGVSATPPTGGHYVYVPPGATVVILPEPAMTATPIGTSAAPTVSPFAPIIAQQNAMMQRMIADVNAMFATPMPDAQQLIRGAMRGLPQAGPGTGVLVTSVSSGNRVCSETITYGYPANGSKPQMHVMRSGDGCGAVTIPGPARRVATPVAPHAIPRVAPASSPPRLWTAKDTARPIGRAEPGT